MSLFDDLNTRILVLDGAMGTMIQSLALEESDFRGDRFADSLYLLKGCNDLLSITRADDIAAIHRQYLDAGADIITTNTFNSNAISLSDYGLEDMVAEVNKAGAAVAREAVDRFIAENPGAGSRYVAGSMGPTSKSLTMSQGLDTEDERVTWDQLVDTYTDQASALIEGGVHLLLIETIFDGLNAKAAAYAARRAMERVGRSVPVVFSMTLTESGRLLSGQTIDAFYASIAHAEPLALSLNCGFGADGMVPYISQMQSLPVRIGVYPNAGLPNRFGQYDESPEDMAEKLASVVDASHINIIGGCCGTTPEHIRALRSLVEGRQPRRVPEDVYTPLAAGLEVMPPADGFIRVGERCNVAGSRKFLRLINEGAIDEALTIAGAQIVAGATVVDVNMDDAMLDSTKEMGRFLSQLATDPAVASAPVMIDSSNWETIVDGLKHVQGKPIVNSISLKEGEEKFLAHARHIMDMGAAVVVMAFDEDGQATSYERRISVCERAYNLLMGIGFPATDIIFDPNVLTIATGIDDHRRYAIDFIRAVAWIKSNLPGAHVSGGLSNLSFAFRGNNPVREAMHALFLSKAVAEGMDMAIVNPSTLVEVKDIPDDLRGAIDDVLDDTDAGATDRLVEIAERYKPQKGGAPVAKAVTKADGDLQDMICRGSTDGLEDALQSALDRLGSAIAVIQGPLMDGMNTVGERFGQGKMFLPQVVKSAHAMRKAVDWLTPVIESEKTSDDSAKAARRGVIATVKGDVHDIGKNIVGVLLHCNGFDVTDLGVMVPAEKIVDAAIECDADFIGLSGLITPSLEEMCVVARLMENRGLSIPLMVGGATASALHTAVKIAPCYSGPVAYTHDAATLPGVVSRLIDTATREEALRGLRQSQHELRERHYAAMPPMSVEQARQHSPRLSFDHIVAPSLPGEHIIDVPLSEVVAMINWRPFFNVWHMDGSMADMTAIQGCGHCYAQWIASLPADKRAQASEAMRLWKDARTALDYLIRNVGSVKAKVVLAKAGSHDETIEIQSGDIRVSLPTPRQLRQSEEPRCSLADFIAPIADDGALIDWIGLFVVTVGDKVQSIVTRMGELDHYKGLLYQSLADRVAEAATEWVHRYVRRKLWGYAADEPADFNPRNLLRADYQGIRPAVGYPSLPDQSVIFIVDKLINYDALGVKLTENGAMWPQSTTSGLMLSHPDAHYFAV